MTNETLLKPDSQMALNLTLNDRATFENFYMPDKSRAELTLEYLKAQCQPLGESFIYLWGNAGTGKSHLLQAACHQAANLGKRSIYLSLSDLLDYAPQRVFEAMDQMDLVCIDDLDIASGHREWERVLFIAFNELRDRGQALLVSASCSPIHLSLDLPDLQSRLSLGLVCQLHEMTDEEKQQALQERSNARGFELSDEVCRYLLARAPRDMGGLFAVLDTLDEKSLAAQRRITIPFVKQTMSW